ncbi:MAG: ABC transporter permease [Lentilitoribacter sp.]
MIGFLLQRLGLILLTVFGASIAAFFFIRVLPGDPVLLMSGERSTTPTRYAELVEQFGFNRSLFSQYIEYLTSIIQGDFGYSLVTKGSVIGEFIRYLPATIELTFFALILAVMFGLPIGILSAMKYQRWFDNLFMAITFVGYSVPVFVSGLLLVILFASTLNWFPVSGRISSLYFIPCETGFMVVDSFISNEKGAFISALHHLFLPSLVLGTIPLTLLVRHTRSAILEVMKEDYIRTARAYGLSEFKIIMRHALKNAMTPILATGGLQVATFLTGAILTETVFSWPGIGTWIVESISRRDYPVIQGGLILLILIVVFVNLIVDLMYRAIDPRIRYG